MAKEPVLADRKLTRRGVIGAAITGAALAGCQTQECAEGAGSSAETFRWKMATTWPPKLPGLGTGAENLARNIEAMSNGRLKIKVYAGGELVPPFEVFDAVSRGTVEMGHGAPYYWKGKSEATQFFCTIPFGLTAQEMNGWLYYGTGPGEPTGLELWRELYDQFDLVPFPAGNTGVQMGGWFNKEINSLADIQGLKMRIPGLGGEVLERAGGTPQTLPGSEIFTALQSGVIDATEWVGPYNDRSFGLHQISRYYYYPGWQEPGPTLECTINKAAYQSLPEDLKEIVAVACQAANTDMLAEYTARDFQALSAIEQEGRVEVRRFPDDVLQRFREIADELVAEIASRDEISRRIYASWSAYRSAVRRSQAIGEVAYRVLD